MRSQIDPGRTSAAVEPLNGEFFYSLKEPQILIEQWRWHHNTMRPHSALGYKPPAPDKIIALQERPTMT